MNKISKNIMLVLSVLSYIGIIMIYPKLPEQIPVHWNLQWEINGWGDKKIILLLGLLPIFILIINGFIKRHDTNNNKKNIKVNNILKCGISMLLIIFNWVSIIIASGSDINMKFILPAFIGVFFILLGNYMPVLKSNFMIGIRNPWTLSNESVWRRTHKAGGYVFIVIGLFMVIMSFMQTEVINKIVFTLLLIGIIVINIYSYLIYQKVMKSQ
ncbi:MAG: SdpI family protein [Anaerocolumna sp.]